MVWIQSAREMLWKLERIENMVKERMCLVL